MLWWWRWRAVRTDARERAGYCVCMIMLYLWIGRICCRCRWWHCARPAVASGMATVPSAARAERARFPVCVREWKTQSSGQQLKSNTYVRRGSECIRICIYYICYAHHRRRQQQQQPRMNEWMTGWGRCCLGCVRYALCYAVCVFVCVCVRQARVRIRLNTKKRDGITQYGMAGHGKSERRASCDTDTATVQRQPAVAVAMAHYTVVA